LKIFLIDVDNTICPFQPTAELYKNTLLKTEKLKYSGLGYFMIVLLKLFWWLPAVVVWQRKLIMGLLSTVDNSSLERASEEIAARVMASYEHGFKKILDGFRRPGDKVFLLTHCPSSIARKIAAGLKFDGEYSINIGSQPIVLDKVKLINKVRAEYRGEEIFYFADDLIDLGALLAADSGWLVNASVFTRFIARSFFPGIKIVVQY
jgi:phosphoserine phosphatase